LKKNKPIWQEFLKMIGIALGTTIGVFTFPLLLDLWVENDSENSGLYNILSSIISKDMPIIYVLIAVATGIGFLFLIYRNFVEKSEDFDRKERDKARTILGLYDELNHYDLLKNLDIIMEKFCKEKDPIYAVQLYKYEHIPQKDEVITKINYVSGYVMERNNLNGMIQQYYELNKKKYKQYKNAVNNFILNTKTIDKLTKEDSFLYALLIDGYTLLINVYPDILDIYIEDEEKEGRLKELLKGNKRVGIYRGILVNNYYTFYYHGNGVKEGRQYITSPAILRNENYVILITLDPDLLSNSDEELEFYFKEFKEILHETFENEYTKLKEGN
jgi:hypothetical protein